MTKDIAPISSVVLFGSGNVATHLAKALNDSGIEIRQVYSRTPEHAYKLAESKQADAITRLSEADTSADLWLISVTDNAIEQVASGLPPFKGIVAHTAGSIPIDVLSAFSNYGVFYPFQTLSKERDVDYNDVPFLIEGNNEETTLRLMKLAGILSAKVSKADSSVRATLHIAAVFSCNFVNHLYTLSADLLEKHGLSFDYLTPLIKETTQKVLSLSPREVQTGPAIRNDTKVMAKHLERLSENPSLQKIYELMSNEILQYYKTTGD